MACNPGMCPDWELNQRPFDLQAGTTSVPQDFRCQLQVIGPWIIHKFLSHLATCRRFPRPYPLGIYFCARVSHRSQRNVCLLKYMIIQINSQMKRYIGWGPEHRSFCALRVGMHHSSGAWMSSPAWELFKLPTIGFYGGFIMWADLSTPCLALFPLWKMGVGLKIPSL